ncbi:TPR repeat-containing protein P27G11.02 [Zalerion maritima]|uniref:TPR repeat-containing protein P27G11.02 n=1 Tax=Zalerion maritima TaxID=339359 RepID=A0AAD5WTV6_9PEZI|nr:TPR repeat-containing protein P27G11.02 [Zalerion maritima]
MFRPASQPGLRAPSSTAQSVMLRASCHSQLRFSGLSPSCVVVRPRPIHIQRSLQLLEANIGNPPPSTSRVETKTPTPRSGFLAACRLSMRSVNGRYRQMIRSLSMLLALSAALAGCWVTWSVGQYAYLRYHARYPQPLAGTLRKALLYSKWRPDPKMAAKYWALALQQCEEMRLDPWSDEVLGIRLKACSWLESIGEYPTLVQNLARLRDETGGWIESFDQGVKEGNITADGVRLREAIKGDEGKVDVWNEQNTTAGQTENLWVRRDRLLGKMLAISVKLADVYASPDVSEDDKALGELEFTVETALRETQKQIAEGKKIPKLPDMTPDQLGSVFERMAEIFMKKGKFDMAMPLLLQALPLSTEPCATSTVMANISATFLQYPPYDPEDSIIKGLLKSQTPPPTTSNPDPKPPAVDKALRVAARNWSSNALKLATETLAKGGLADEDAEKCTLCSMMATLNLGVIEERMGNSDKAAQRYSTVIHEKGAGGAMVLAGHYYQEAGEAMRRARDGLVRLGRRNTGYVPTEEEVLSSKNGWSWKDLSEILLPQKPRNS